MAVAALHKPAMARHLFMSDQEIDQQALDALDEERTEGQVIHPDRKQNPHE